MLGFVEVVVVVPVFGGDVRPADASLGTRSPAPTPASRSAVPTPATRLSLSGFRTMSPLALDV
jgi:hypothetical protein